MKITGHVNCRFTSQIGQTLIWGCSRCVRPGVAYAKYTGLLMLRTGLLMLSMGLLIVMYGVAYAKYGLLML